MDFHNMSDNGDCH